MYRYFLLPLLAFLAPTACLRAQSVWDGGAGTSNWTDAANWNPVGVPLSSDDVQFTGTGTYTINLNGNQTADILTFSGDTGYSLNNNMLTLTNNNAIVVASPSSGTVTHTINSDLNLASSETINVGSSANLSLTGTLSGLSSLSVNGGGTLTLLTNATYTGTTSVNSSTLQIGTGGTTGSIAGDLATQGSAQINFNRSDNVTYAGFISGNGLISQDGTGSVTLTGPSNLLGEVDINGSGALIFNGGVSSFFSVIYVNRNGTSPGTLDVDGTGTSLLAANVAVGLSGTGTMNVTNGAHASFSSLDVLAGSTVNVKSGGLLSVQLLNQSGTIVLDNGTLAISRNHTSPEYFTLNSGGGTIDVANGVTSTFNGVISGTGSLTKTSSGTLSLKAANTYSGGTVISGGRITANNTSGSATGSGAVTVNSSGIIGGGNGASSSGTLTTLGTGANIPSRQNYTANSVGIITGALTINSGGHLAPGNSVGTLTTATLTLSSGAILDYEFNGTANDFTAVMTPGGLTLNGGGINLYQEGTTTAFSTAGTYNLLGYSGTLSGSLTNLSVLNATSGYTYTFVNDSTDGLIQLNIAVAVPEPSSWALLGGGVLALLVFSQLKAFKNRSRA